MQLSGILILALAVASGFAVPLDKGDEDRMKNLISAANDFILAQNAKMEPVELPDFHGDTSKIPFLHDIMRANLSLTNGFYYGYNVAAIENIKTSAGHLRAQLNIRNPRIGVTGDYQIDGKLGDLKVKGAGNYAQEVYNLTTSLENIQMFETENKALRIRSFGVRLDFEGNKFLTSGLSIEGVNVTAYEKLVDAVFHQDFDLIKDRAAKVWEFAVIRGMNKLIGDRTLEEVVEYLKEHKDDDFNHLEKYHHEQMMTLLSNLVF